MLLHLQGEPQQVARCASVEGALLCLLLQLSDIYWRSITTGRIICNWYLHLHVHFLVVFGSSKWQESVLVMGSSPVAGDPKHCADTESCGWHHVWACKHHQLSLWDPPVPQEHPEDSQASLRHWGQAMFKLFCGNLFLLYRLPPWFQVAERPFEFWRLQSQREKSLLLLHTMPSSMTGLCQGLVMPSWNNIFVLWSWFLKVKAL